MAALTAAVRGSRHPWAAAAQRQRQKQEEREAGEQQQEEDRWHSAQSSSAML